MPGDPPVKTTASTAARRWLDGLTEGTVYAMVLFSPWAFGTTQPWSIQIMNIGGCLLGGLLALKWCLRAQSTGPAGAALTSHHWLLGGLTLAILAYVLISALNAEFVYLPREWRQESLPHVNWLPHSLDRDATWSLFWNWLALACTFWAVHDWLSGDIGPDGQRRGRRWRRMITVLTVNGALVALEGIIQRNAGTAKLLFFMPTRDNPTAAAQFGPFAYRANAAQFFNLIWPAALAAWWQWQSRPKRRSQAHHGILPCVMLLATGSLVSLSRGGVGITLLQLAACGLVLVGSGYFRPAARLGLILVFAATVAAAAYFGWDELAPRLQAADPLSGRSETYQLAARMAQDYPWFGIGPGAFGSVFQLYRNSPGDYWPGQLHNDWLETLITFGRLGSALLLAAGAWILARWFRGGGIRIPWPFVAFFWIALGGCLLHARFDFPLQIYSIQFVFVLLCAALFSFSRPARAGS